MYTLQEVYKIAFLLLSHTFRDNLLLFIKVGYIMVKFKYDPQLNIVHVYPEGELSILDIGNHFKEAAKNEKFKEGLVRIIYFEKVTNFLYSSTEASMIPKLYKDFKSALKIKASILIGNHDLHYGIARMVQNLFEVNNFNEDVFVVRNADEALQLAKELSKK